jgi:hypothetical protein
MAGSSAVWARQASPSEAISDTDRHMPIDANIKGRTEMRTFQIPPSTANSYAIGQFLSCQLARHSHCHTVHHRRSLTFHRTVIRVRENSV